MKLWGGRFSKPTDEVVEQFTSSLKFDVRLWSDDIKGSVAYARMLAGSGIIEPQESNRIIDALQEIHTRFEQATVSFLPGDEDIHSVIERLLTEKLGPELAGKLHSGRSRNDQVATDLRLYLKTETPAVMALIKLLQSALAERAEADGDIVMPGYTHLQRAQPVLLAHHLLAHFWALQRDVSRLEDCLERIDVLPLGSGAVAGSNLPVNRDFLAKELGFSRITENTLDAVSDRDFVAEILFSLALLGTHLSRMGEELVLWTSQEFSFAKLDDAYATGSSMMPQKKNPDTAELTRGKTGRLIGNLVNMLTVLKGLPLSYNRDLQEDKEPLFDSLDTVKMSLQVMAGVYQTLNFDKESISGSLGGHLMATDYAERLVGEGLPLRKAHELIGRAVLKAEEKNCEIHELNENDWSGLQSPANLAGAAEEIIKSVDDKKTPGSTSHESVRQQLAKAKKLLN